MPRDHTSRRFPSALDDGYLITCLTAGTVMKTDNHKRVSLGGKRTDSSNLSVSSSPCPRHTELELRPDLNIAAPCHVCMLMFTATVEQQVDQSGTELKCQVQSGVPTLAAG